jgi:hypothetical protein
MPPLALDDAMLDRLTAAAALLPVAQRDHFMRSVANRINSLHRPPGMAELEVAISFVLNTRGIGGGFQAFTNKSSDKVAARARADRQFLQFPYRSSA